MEKPSKHIFVCKSFRMSGDAQGVCAKQGDGAIMQYLQEELDDRGLTDVFISSTSCLKVCDRGPAMVIYPDNIWYGGVNDEEDIDKILDALEEDSVCEEYLIS